MNDAILVEQQLSATEQKIVADLLGNAAVKKYLAILALDLIKDIVYSQPDTNETPESYLRRVALVKGRLEALNTLLEIPAASNGIL